MIIIYLMYDIFYVILLIYNKLCMVFENTYNI